MRTLVQLTSIALTLGLWVVHALGGTPIADGSFEQGPPPSSGWSLNNSSTCERIGDFSSTWYVSPYDGSNDYWPVGICDTGSGNVPVTSSVEQQVTVPPGMTQLSFYYISFRQSADDSPLDNDHAYVAVNGIEVWSILLVQANNTYPNWSEVVTLDLSSYAGQTITLSFGGVSEGKFTGNLRFDLIALAAPAPVAEATWGAIKALYQ